MTVNLDIPILNRKLILGMPQRGKADEISRAVDKAADDASGRLSSVRLPQVDLSGAVQGARRTIDQAVRSLSEGTDAVAQGAERAAAQAGQRAAHLGEDLDTAVKDLRSLRVTRDRGRDPWPGVALITGAVAGVVAMFLFDPRDGKRRRTVLRDKLGKWGRVASREARGKAVDLRNRSQGVIHEARSALGSVRGDESTESGEQPGQLSATESAGAGHAETGQESQAVAVAVGSGGATGAAAGDYSEWTGEAGRPNGRETNS